MGLYWSVEWEKREIAEDVPYFYAQYRQENPVKPGSDYLIADIKGKGHYAGTVLSVRASHPGWFGEGDDRFYVDGDSIPTLHGTGTEDYFNDAWAFRVVNRPNYRSFHLGRYECRQPYNCLSVACNRSCFFLKIRSNLPLSTREIYFLRTIALQRPIPRQSS